MRARANADATMEGSTETCTSWYWGTRSDGECEGYVQGTYESPSTTCTGDCFFTRAKFPANPLSTTCDSCVDAINQEAGRDYRIPDYWPCYDAEDAVSTTKCTSDDIAKMRDDDDSTWLSADCWLCLSAVAKDVECARAYPWSDDRDKMQEIDPDTGEIDDDYRPGDCITDDIAAACGVTDLNKVSAGAHAVSTATALVAAITTFTFGSQL